jgi:hypothetical protein
MTIVRNIAPILETATVQTRTQATYQPTAQSVVAMTSELDLSVTVPQGTAKIGLTWEIMGECEEAIGYVVYKDVDGGGYNLVAASRDGSANYWSVITVPTNDVSNNGTANTSSVSLIDTSPDTGSVVTYRLYLAEVRNDGAVDFMLNRNRASTGAAFNPNGSSTGELICYA